MASNTYTSIFVTSPWYMVIGVQRFGGVQRCKDTINDPKLENEFYMSAKY